MITSRKRRVVKKLQRNYICKKEIIYDILEYF